MAQLGIGSLNMDYALRDELALWFTKFGGLLSSGVFVTTALAQLERETSNPRLRQATHGISDGVSRGRNLADTFREYPDLFDEHLIAFVSGAERCGIVPAVLPSVAHYILDPGANGGKGYQSDGPNRSPSEGSR